MPRVLFIAHDHVSPPGIVGDCFADRGWDIKELLVVPADRFHDPGVDVDLPDPRDYDAIVPLGAPWAVYDDELVGSWVRPELEMLRAADAAGVPVLGICFGGQLLAAAHGGSVDRAPSFEIGWHVVHTDDATIVPSGPWFQWHMDRWQLPPGAREIARNAAASQAFVLRRNLALQFHPELDPVALKMWLDEGGADEARARGLDPDVLVAHTRAEEPAARQRTKVLVDAFLDRVATA
jgi:GMP synthase-like glutamine amidotransferase